MRLIDADALIEEINIQKRTARTSYPKQYFVVGDVLTCIYNAPTVDAVPIEQYNELKLKYESMKRTTEILDEALRGYQRRYE